MTQPPQSPYGQGNPVGPGPHGPGGQQYGQQPPGYPTQGGTQQPQPQWQPQPPYGQQWQAPPPGPSKGGKAGRILTIVGLVLVVGAALLGGGAALAGGSVRPAESAMIDVQGATEVPVADEQMQVIYTTDPVTSCSVTGPSDTVPNVTLSFSMNFDRDGAMYSAIGKMGGPGEANGTYTVECDGDAVVGPAMNVGALTATVLMIVAAVGLATLGVILLIVGLVLRASAKKRN